jgi:hypothetical protein
MTNLGAEILPGDPRASVGGPAGEEPKLRENPATGTRLCGRPASIGRGLGHRGIDPGVRVGLPQLLWGLVGVYGDGVRERI